MNYKKIEIGTTTLEELREYLKLDDTINLFDMIEDLSDVINTLASCDDCHCTTIATVARLQKMLIEFCRLN